MKGVVRRPEGKAAKKREGESPWGWIRKIK